VIVHQIVVRCHALAEPVSAECSSSGFSTVCYCAAMPIGRLCSSFGDRNPTTLCSLQAISVQQTLLTLLSQYEHEHTLHNRAHTIAEGLGGAVHALAAHPINADLYATAGADSAVRLWSCSSRRCAATVVLDAAVTALAFELPGTPDGRLAVGLGGGASPGGRQGVLVLLDAATLQVSVCVFACAPSLSV
jgi:WD40 repeat protein